MAHGMSSGPPQGRQLKVQETMCGKSVTKVNEAALSNVLADVTFIESEIKRLERPALDKVFDEVKMVSCPLIDISPGSS